MATLDPRLLDLIETLVATRLDWLAFELMDGIRVGRQTPEAAGTLAAVRRSVRLPEQPTAKEAKTTQREQAMPIEGDEQIEWAANHVVDRLDALIAELSAAMDNLDILRGTEGRSALRASDEKAGGPLVIVLDGEEPRKVDRGGIDVALAALPDLRAQIMAWSNQVRRQVRT